MKAYTKCSSAYDYFKQLKDIEENLVAFLDKQDNLNENFIIFSEYLQNEKITDSKYTLKSFLYLIVAISNNYHRSQDFILKIERILESIHEKIQSHFTSFEIFHIFHKSKRLLLSLFKSKIIIPTEDIFSIIINKEKDDDRKYLQYFYPEFEPYFDEKMKKSIQNQIKDLNDEFNKKRESGENDDYLCRLIQNDLIVDFISYLEKTNLSPSTTIQSSIYETNLFLINKNPTLIEYSAFYGSIQIFKYLYNKKIEVKTSIWPYAIHGRNAEIIKLLEENDIKTLNDSFQYLVIESIKCHHNEIAEYFRNNVGENEKIYDYYLYRKSLKYYNFAFFTDNDIGSLINSCEDNQKLNITYYLCKYDYFMIVEFLFYKKFKTYSYVNNKYHIFKPTEKYKDIVRRIAIKNGDLIPKLEKEEKYIKYEYEEETSTILNIAIRKGNIDIIQFLLKLPKINIDIDSTKSKKKFFGHYKCERKNDRRYYCDKIYYGIFNEAIESGYVDVFQFLLNNVSCNVNCTQSKDKSFFDCFTTAHMKFQEHSEKMLLHHAIEKENIGIIKLLLSNPNINIKLESTSRINKSGGCSCYSSTHKIFYKSALYFAVEKENLEIVKILIEKPKIDVNFGLALCESDKKSIHKTPYQLASEKQNNEICQLLSSVNCSKEFISNDDSKRIEEDDSKFDRY